jgi:glycosyltransferase involved in cell wall biosynthesis
METLRLLAIVEPPLLPAGPGKLLLDFASIARDGRFEPAVETTIAEFRELGDPAVFLEAGRAAGIPVVDLSKWNRWDRKVVGELVSLIQDLKPDIVQTDALLSHFVARVAGVPRLVPWVAFHHGYTWPDLRTRVVYNQADRWSLRAATRVVTACNAFRDQLRRRGIPERRISVVQSAIDPQWGAGVRRGAASLRARLAIPSARKIILSVGRLSREKGHVTLVEALARLRQEGAPETHLLLVGEGPERRRIEARARARRERSRHAGRKGSLRAILWRRRRLRTSFFERRSVHLSARSHGYRRADRGHHRRRNSRNGWSSRDGAPGTSERPYHPSPSSA